MTVTYALVGGAIVAAILTALDLLIHAGDTGPDSTTATERNDR